MKQPKAGRHFFVLLLWIIMMLPAFQTAAQIPHSCSTDSCFHAVVVKGILSPRPDTIPLDTHITRFYQPEIYPAGLIFPAITGTTGHPAIDVFRKFQPQGTGNFWHNPYQPYALTPENLQVIRTDVPFSEWYYLIGANREQIFRGTHAQDAGKNFNFGMDIRFINSKGAYLHEHAKASWFGVYAQYRDPKLPLQSDLMFVANRAVTEENGGIADRTYFEDTVKIIREAAPVWLETAQNSHRSTELVWQTRWYPGQSNTTIFNPKTENGEAAGDTLTPEPKTQRGVNDHFLLEFSYKRSWFLYHDPNPFNEWYPQVRYDTTVTHDSVCYNAIVAKMAYHLSIKNKLFASAGIAIERYRFYDTLDPGGSGTVITPFTHWEFRFFPQLNLNATAMAKYDQAFGASHELSAILRWEPLKSVVLSIKLKDWSDFPYRQDLRYGSNHYLWEYDMQNQHFTQFSPSVALVGKFPVELSGVVTRIGKFIYYNNQALPNQYSGTLAMFQVLLASHGDLGPLTFNGQFAWQRASDASIIRVPSLLGELMTGYKFRLFRGKISAIGGVVVHGRTVAYLDEYNPVTRVFFHTTRPPIKDYIWADPFLTLVLKKTRFMLKYEHASAWLAGFGQYSLPGYPMTDPAFKFAVAWRFMD